MFIYMYTIRLRHKTCKFAVIKHDRNASLGRTRYRCDDDIKLNHRKYGGKILRPDKSGRVKGPMAGCCEYVMNLMITGLHNMQGAEEL